MGRHKYRKRKSENYEYVNQTAEGSALFDFAKTLTKKTAEAALKKGTAKVGRKLGEKAVDSFFGKKSSLSDRGAELLSQKPVESENFVENKDLYQSPEESGYEIYEILSSASKMKPEMKINKNDSEEIKKSKNMKGLTQKEMNENLNRLMNM